MKKKLLAALLGAVISTVSLSSCVLPTLKIGVSDPAPENTTINVQGGSIYEEINITSTADKNLLAASKALLSSVNVTCTFEKNESGSIKKTTSYGSGVIYSLDKNKGDAYIITNYHVVYDSLAITKGGISDEIYVNLYGMERPTASDRSYAIKAKYVGGAISYDIAVLKVTGSTVLMKSNARAVTVANSDEVAILDTAIAIGNPGAMGISATVGHINVDSQEIFLQISDTLIEVRVMRTDAAVNSGNSGGGLFNDKGELIGIINAREADDSINNIGYAIPSNVAKAIADNAIFYSDGTVKRCLMGVTVGVDEYSTDYDVETGKIHKRERVIIISIEKSSQIKGLLSVGDRINSITVDGKTTEVTRIHHVIDAMLYARAGSHVVINVTRGGVEKNIEFTATATMLKKC